MRGSEGGKVIQNGLDDNELERCTADLTVGCFAFWRILVSHFHFTPLNLG